MPRGRWPTHPDGLAEVERQWQEPWGDRRQELVFIGAGLDEAAIRAALDEALMPEGALMPDGALPEAGSLPDPFPAWGSREVA